MLVIHPKDRTTAALSALYGGMADVLQLDQSMSNKCIKHALNHCSSHEQIYLLGHGSENGLFSRTDDTKDEFDRLIVNRSHGYYLRRHNGNIVGVWCNADLFARKEGLHGLFSGMIISEMSEAELYGIATTPDELIRETSQLVKRLRSLLDEAVPLREIPLRLREMDDSHTPLTEFNYKNFHYL